MHRERCLLNVRHSALQHSATSPLVDAESRQLLATHLNDRYPGWASPAGASIEKQRSLSWRQKEGWWQCCRLVPEGRCLLAGSNMHGARCLPMLSRVQRSMLFS